MLPQTSDAYFVGSLTNAQRLEAVERLRHGRVRGLIGITGIPDYVFGTSLYTAPLTSRLREDFAARLSSCGGTIGRQGRGTYLMNMRRHRAILAVTGYGELTYRHGEALQQGCTLVAQNLDHIETGFPFQHGHNVVFVRPDLHDLVERVDEVVRGDYPSVPRQAAIDWAEWSRSPQRILERGITAHLRAVS